MGSSVLAEEICDSLAEYDVSSDLKLESLESHARSVAGYFNKVSRALIMTLLRTSHPTPIVV